MIKGCVLSTAGSFFVVVEIIIIVYMYMNNILNNTVDKAETVK